MNPISKAHLSLLNAIVILLCLQSTYLQSVRAEAQALIFFFPPPREIIRKSVSVQTFDCVISLFMVGIPLLAFDL